MALTGSAENQKITPQDLVSVIMGFQGDKMLEQYIHDYLVRKNLHSVAETFAQEADFQPRRVALKDGFLSDWWSMFWDVYSPRPEYQASTSTPHETASPNALPDLPVPDHSFIRRPGSPVPDHIFIRRSSMRSPPGPNQLHPEPHQISSASVSPMPDQNYMVQNMSPSMTPVSGPSPTVEETSSLPALNALDLRPYYNRMLAQLPQISAITPDKGSSRYRCKRQANNKQRNPAAVGRAVNNGIVFRIPAEPADPGLLHTSSPSSRNRRRQVNNKQQNPVVGRAVNNDTGLRGAAEPADSGKY